MTIETGIKLDEKLKCENNFIDLIENENFNHLDNKIIETNLFNMDIDNIIDLNENEIRHNNYVNIINSLEKQVHLNTKVSLQKFNIEKIKINIEKLYENITKPDSFLKIEKNSKILKKIKKKINK